MVGVFNIRGRGLRVWGFRSPTQFFKSTLRGIVQLKHHALDLPTQENHPVGAGTREPTNSLGFRFRF